jgi:hypothetical protein
MTADRVDELELILDPAKRAADGRYSEIGIRINGVELKELVRNAELPFALAEYDARRADGETEADLGKRGALAGDYLYLSSTQTLSPSRNFLGEPYQHGSSAPATKSLLLRCPCGITDCWFLLARITVGDVTVTWSDFEQFHRRDWRYEIGPFVFERSAYIAQFGPP